MSPGVFDQWKTWPLNGVFPSTNSGVLLGWGISKPAPCFYLQLQVLVITEGFSKKAELQKVGITPNGGISFYFKLMN